MKTISTTKQLLLLTLCTVFFCSPLCHAQKNNSKVKGVQIGAITYSFRDMPDKSLEAILKYTVEAGLSSVELMGGQVEQYAGIPRERDEVRGWRTSVSMDKFKEIKKMFNAQGVKIDILKLGDPGWTDEEIDYAFRVCKTLGARGISMEISENTAKRMAPFGKKHKLFVIMHNHGQPGDPNFSFERTLEHGDYLRLNFDVGHYFGATGKNPADLIKKLHKQIASIHVKDKTGPDDTPKDSNMPLGEGKTPLGDIFRLIRDQKYPITCDIEQEYKVPEGSDQVKEVRKCLEYCKKLLE